jgi:hypothetical protein
MYLYIPVCCYSTIYVFTFIILINTTTCTVTFSIMSSKTTPHSSSDSLSESDSDASTSCTKSCNSSPAKTSPSKDESDVTVETKHTVSHLQVASSSTADSHCHCHCERTLSTGSDSQPDPIILTYNTPEERRTQRHYVCKFLGFTEEQRAQREIELKEKFRTDFYGNGGPGGDEKNSSHCMRVREAATLIAILMGFLDGTQYGNACDALFDSGTMWKQIGLEKPSWYDAAARRSSIDFKMDLGVGPT